MKKEIIFFAAIGLPILVQAQTDPKSDTAQQLKTVVVSATRQEIQPENASRSVTVITSEQIQSSPYKNVGELLSMQEGIYVVGADQNVGSVQTLFMRGTNSNHTVIMIDGVRITDPSNVNNAVDLTELSLSNVDRIEIVRGAHSTMYGSSAIGGVINIITKKNAKTGMSGNAELNGGSFAPGGSMFGFQAFANYTLKSGFYINGSAFMQNINGIDATEDTVTNPATYNVRDKDDFQKTDLSLKTGYRGKNLDAWFGLRSASQLADIDRSAYTDDDNYTLQFDRVMFLGGAEYRIDSTWKFQYYGGYTALQRIALNDSSVVDAAGTYDQTYSKSTFDGSNQNHELQISFVKHAFSIVFGGGMYGETMNNTSYTYWAGWESESDLDTMDLNQNTYFGFAALELDAGKISEKLKGLHLNAGARFNHNSIFGDYLTWQINPSLKTSENGLLFFSFSTGFNAPSLYQLYAPDADWTSGITRGNPLLTPEKAQSLEFGYRHNLGKNTQINFSVFSNTIDNIIEYVYIWDGTVGIDTLDYMDYRGDAYINAGKLINNGMEIGIRSQLSKSLAIDAHLSIISGRMEYDPNKADLTHLEGNTAQLYTNGQFLTETATIINLPRRPSAGKVTLSYTPNEKLLFAFTTRMAGARYDVFYDSNNGPFGSLNTALVKEYTVFDFNLQWKAFPWMTFVFKAENILDTRYNEINGFRTRGRGFYGTLRFSL
jgi:vitamin B12 transporter